MKRSQLDEKEVAAGIRKEVKSRLEQEASKPFKVSIMGQTGVGKSSLVNALFNTHFATDPVLPCTKDIECHIEKKFEREIWFYDLPGIGESYNEDAKRIEQYKQKLTESDVVLWAIHGDNRSVAFDLDTMGVSHIPNLYEAPGKGGAISG